MQPPNIVLVKTMQLKIVKFELIQNSSIVDNCSISI